MKSSSINFIIFIFLANIIFFPLKSFSRQFIERDHIIIDLLSGVEWLRCSTGQTWDGKECTGQVVRLNFSEIKEALKQANEQLGNGWRLPTLKELEGLVCNECKENKKFSDTATINKEIFPSTPSEPFWTSDKNKWSEDRYWTVNFFTGFSFNRFTEFKPLASRFVKDR